MKFTRLASAMIMCTASLPILAASYTVAELPTQNVSQNQYAASIDNAGLILATTQNNFNPPIDLSLIDFESATIIANLTDIESAKNGNFNIADYTYLVNRAFTATANFSVFTQQLSRFLAYKTDGTSADYVRALDTESEALGGFSFSMETSPVDSIAGNHIVGNTVGPFTTIDHVNEAGETVQFVVSDFDQRAFIQVNDIGFSLTPIDVTLGGTSNVNAINDNYIAVGIGSIAGTALLTDGIAACADLELRGDQPEKACERSIKTTISGSNVIRRTGLWVQRAHVWSMDIDGNVVDTQTYGTLLTEEEQALSGTSRAADINNADIAVGVASVQVEGRTIISTAAAIFQNGEVTRIIEGDEFLPNSAVSINDAGYVVGVRAQIINQAQRSKMFVYNMANEELNFPTGFFTSSSTIPRSINNSGVVVGAGDIEATASTARRTAGFVYDIEADTFLELNALISCERQLDLTLIEGVDINDSGDIVATAIAKRPSRNVRGEILKDANGDDLLVDTWITVKLSPTGDAPAVCSEDESDVLVRNGASTGLLLFSMLFGAALFRRMSLLVK
jgi:hypothetical protein